MQDIPERTLSIYGSVVVHDPLYSAAWKLLGKAPQGHGDTEGARVTWGRGMVVAQTWSDKQVEKEVGVFLRRLDKI